MRTCSLSKWILIATVVALSFASPPAFAVTVGDCNIDPADSRPRLIPIGDSLTEAGVDLQGGQWGYRGPLQKLLRADHGGADPYDFVGFRFLPANRQDVDDPGAPALDNHYAGIGGAKAQGILNWMKEPPDSSIEGPLVPCFEDAPEGSVVLLNIGSNRDALIPGDERTREEITHDNVIAIVQRINELDPLERFEIYVAIPSPTSKCEDVFCDPNAELRPRIQALMQEEDFQGRLHMVDMAAAFQTNGNGRADYGDPRVGHPSKLGYQIMARVWHRALTLKDAAEYVDEIVFEPGSTPATHPENLIDSDEPYGEYGFEVLKVQDDAEVELAEGGLLVHNADLGGASIFRATAGEGRTIDAHDTSRVEVEAATVNGVRGSDSAVVAIRSGNIRGPVVSYDDASVTVESGQLQNFYSRGGSLAIEGGSFARRDYWSVVADGDVSISGGDFRSGLKLDGGHTRIDSGLFGYRVYPWFARTIILDSSIQLNGGQLEIRGGEFETGLDTTLPHPESLAVQGGKFWDSFELDQEFPAWDESNQPIFVPLRGAGIEGNLELDGFANIDARNTEIHAELIAHGTNRILLDQVRVTGEIRGMDSALIGFMGGNAAGLSAQGHSRIDWSGGILTGTSPEVTVSENGQLIIYGAEFEVDGVEIGEDFSWHLIEPDDGTLKGTLASGDSLAAAGISYSKLSPESLILLLDCDALGGDQDGDGVCDPLDNCIFEANEKQLDSDRDGYGNRCDADVDNDCVVDQTDIQAVIDHFGSMAESTEYDLTDDGIVGVIDILIAINIATGSSPWPGFSAKQTVCEEPDPADADGDGVADSWDNCTDVSNVSQADFDDDGFGDACDLDLNGDCMVDALDVAWLETNKAPAGVDAAVVTAATGRFAGPSALQLPECAWSFDADGDGHGDLVDNCVEVANTDQADADGDGYGDLCDLDETNDCEIDDLDEPFPAGVVQHGPSASVNTVCEDVDDDGYGWHVDNCLTVYNTDQVDSDLDGFGDACDYDLNNDCFVDRLDLDLASAAQRKGVIGFWGLAMNHEVSGSPVLDCDPLENPDGDAVKPSYSDLCPQAFSPSYMASDVGNAQDSDGDGLGDACDLDFNNDCVVDSADRLMLFWAVGGFGPPRSYGTTKKGNGFNYWYPRAIGRFNLDGDYTVDRDDLTKWDQRFQEPGFGLSPPDMQALGFCGGPDYDGDGLVLGIDNCPFVANPGQLDTDTELNSTGDACEWTP
ncbi:MAG: thrombospondin type 3 repeat-containing protein [Deltaproteobacteria bacterium]|nr:thrombospondin type 3 repeat-containing protein [Deltaproteobacteria bacterium]